MDGPSCIFCANLTPFSLWLLIVPGLTPRFSNRTALQTGYAMMATDNRTSAMAVLVGTSPTATNKRNRH
jgi:hypothetical protein